MEEAEEAEVVEAEEEVVAVEETTGIVRGATSQATVGAMVLVHTPAVSALINAQAIKPLQLSKIKWAEVHGTVQQHLDDGGK